VQTGQQQGAATGVCGAGGFEIAAARVGLKIALFEMVGILILRSAAYPLINNQLSKVPPAIPSPVVRFGNQGGKWSPSKAL
jgi:hypothetical protein